MTSVTFNQLPYKKDGPRLNAWGAYDGNQELGRLNLITPESVQRGRDAIKSGLAVNLNLPLNYDADHPARAVASHKILQRPTCYDDEVTFNTQGSTQWDGFRHYPYQNWPSEGVKTFYGGMTRDEAGDPSSNRNGTQNFVHHPITSRAHLLDVPRYLSKNNLPPLEPFSHESPITLAILRDCAAQSRVTFAPGDILLVRTGYVDAHSKFTPEQKAEFRVRSPRAVNGVQSSDEVLRWHWENGIAAVASDNPAYEAYTTSGGPLRLHEVFLAGWGMPIGELFDLRVLAEECVKRDNWTFMFTSMPLYVEAGIASPPNAQAIL